MSRYKAWTYLQYAPGDRADTRLQGVVSETGVLGRRCPRIKCPDHLVRHLSWRALGLAPLGARAPFSSEHRRSGERRASTANCKLGFEVAQSSVAKYMLLKLIEPAARTSGKQS